MNSIYIQLETSTDIDVIDQLNREAFDGEGEPNLIKLLRNRNELLVSLVAAVDDTIVGHVCASPVSVDGNNHSIAGIGPLSVYKSHRCCGIGGALMEEIIVQLRDEGCIAAVLLGNPNYYHRFGFQTASNYKLDNEYNATDAFMAMELQDCALENINGMIKYVSAFAECDA